MARSQPADNTLLIAALEELGGPALILDRELRVVQATAGVEALLGAPAQRGMTAARLLCGHAAQRPLAEALAQGRSASASIVRPTPDGGERVLRARAVPVTAAPEPDAAERGPQGWVLLLELEEGSADTAHAPVQFHGMWTADAGMKRMFRIIERVARREASVLLRGETGAGKELVAHAIHALSPRRAGPFHAINCAALPPNLLESELFGHVRGAFTGAVRDNPGHFRLASKGTLFLDEVAELPLDLQAKLLRVLETRQIIPVGGREPIAVDVRIVAATHRGLRQQVAAGRFRADLMYRLRVVPIFLPPLRERGGDLLLLAGRFIEEFNRQGDRRIERISAGARALLQHYDWPGNVRELRNVIEYAFVIGDGPVLVEADLPPELSAPDAQGAAASAAAVNAGPAPDPARSAAAVDEALVRHALERAGGHRGQAAKILGISRATLWRRMKSMG